MQTSAQSQETERQSSWQSYGQQQQASRQDYGKEAQNSRQDYADDYHGGGCCYGGYHGYYGAPTGGAFAAGMLTGMTVGSMVTAASFQASTEPKTTVVVSGVTYYQVGTTWYQPVYQSGQVTYVVVNPPK